MEELNGWWNDGACKGLDSKKKDWFYPDKETGDGKRRANRARDICNSCPVIAECLHDALVRNEQFGIWGMTSPRQRLDIRRKYKATNMEGDIIRYYETIDECVNIINDIRRSKGRMMK
ncbi:hypothetical protein CL620_06145 [archaeon]|nr:hypothetical protein [archaeon]